MRKLKFVAHLTTIGTLKSKRRKHPANRRYKKFGAVWGRKCENTAVNQEVNCDLMVEAANQYDKQRPDVEVINHISGQGVLEGKSLMNPLINYPHNDDVRKQNIFR